MTDHIQPGTERTLTSNERVLRDALKLIAAGPPAGMDNSEVAAWAAWIASRALARPASETTPQPFTPYRSLDYLKTPEDLEAYVQERIRLATAENGTPQP